MPANTSQIGITGATGRLGGRIAARLAAAGVGQRLIVRNPARAPKLPNSDIAVATYSDPRACAEALAGIDTVLMVSGAETPDRVQQHFTFIDAAVRAGVQTVVYTSFYGAAADATFTLARDHWATEEYLRASGLNHVILRDNLYLDFMPMMVGTDGVIRGPAADGRAAAVAQDDIADVAAAVLSDPKSHRGNTYHLTGPESLNFDEVAATLTQHLGQQVGYHRETLEQAYASRAEYHAPDWQLDAWVSTYTAIAAGELAGVTTDVPTLLGRPAMSLEELLSRS